MIQIIKINIVNWSVYITVQILITTFRALAWSDNYYFSLLRAVVSPRSLSGLGG